jgi:hypothetical protein
MSALDSAEVIRYGTTLPKRIADTSKNQPSKPNNSPRHPNFAIGSAGIIVLLADPYCRYQRDTIKTPGEVSTANVTGIVACYLGLAYSLYLLDHNVERTRDAGRSRPGPRHGTSRTSFGRIA